MFDGFILETTAAPGSSAAIVLSGAAAGRRAFLGPGAFTSGAQVFYVMDDGTKQEWGVGTLTGGASTTLTRDAAPRNSAGTNVRLNFGGTTRVYSALLPERAGYKTAAGGFSLPSSVVSNPLWAGASAGSATAYTVSTTPVETAYVAGAKVVWRAHATCGNAPTIQYGALGVKTLRRIVNGQVRALLPGDIVAGQIVEMVYSDAAATWLVTSRHGGDGPMQSVYVSQNSGAVSAVDFDLPAGFDAFCLQVESAAPAANAVPMLRFSLDGGATYSAGASDYTNAAVQGLAAAVSAQGGNAAQVALGPTTLASSFSLHGEVWFRAGGVKSVRGIFSGPTTGPVPFIWPVGAWCNVAGTPTHVRFGFVGQNVASHRLRLLGGRFD